LLPSWHESSNGTSNKEHRAIREMTRGHSARRLQLDTRVGRQSDLSRRGAAKDRRQRPDARFELDGPGASGYAAEACPVRREEELLAGGIGDPHEVVVTDEDAGSGGGIRELCRDKRVGKSLG